jgi:hypothetical protein
MVAVAEMVVGLRDHYLVAEMVQVLDFDLLKDQSVYFLEEFPVLLT